MGKRHDPGSAPSLGVEEEFLLLDPGTGRARPVVDKVLGALPGPVRERGQHEFRPSQLELATPVAEDLTSLRGHLVHLRRTAAEASRTAGALLVAVGATPLPDPTPPLSDDPRYVEMARRFGAVAEEPAVCGCHVHVELPDRDLAVQVSNHLRRYLPVVQAMTANSPLYDGRDTGYASWRTIQFTRWPSAGPAPYLDSARDYDETVEQLIAAGVMMDAGMVYWYTRLSASYPTVEVRVGDVCPTVEETVLMAALIRGLVAHFADEAAQGRLAPRVPDCLVAAAHWRAARDGLDGQLLDAGTGTVRPAWQLVEELVATIRPELTRHGDWDAVAAQLAVLRGHGNGAVRQRDVHRRTGDVQAVIAHLAEETKRGTR